MRILALLLLLPVGALAGDQIDYAAWAGKVENAHGQWTPITEQAVRNSTLLSEEPKDVGRFCPSYATLSTDDRVRFWVSLISVITREESQFDPKNQFVEPRCLLDGKQKSGHISPQRSSVCKHEISYGLLQLSPESASQKAYGCGKMTPELLMEADVNLRCGTNQLAYQVRKHGVITSEIKTWVGAGNVFSTLWPESKKGKVNEIVGFTSELPFCRSASTNRQGL